MPRAFKILWAGITLGIALSACQGLGTGTGAVSGGNPAEVAGVRETPSLPVAAANNAGSDVMAPVSDHSESQGDDVMKKLEEVQRSYPNLKLPRKFATFLGPQPPETQTPLPYPEPSPVWQNECWEESLVLNIQALDWIKEGDVGHFVGKDIKAGPYARIMVAQPSTEPNNEFDWTSAFYWDVPLQQETKDGLVSNIRTTIRRAMDSDILVSMYYRPPADATSTTDFTPSPFPDPANCDPNKTVCMMRGFENFDAWDAFVKEPHILFIGRYRMDIDENHSPCVVQTAAQQLVQDPQANPSDASQEGIIVIPQETQPTDESTSLKDIFARPPLRRFR